MKILIKFITIFCIFYYSKSIAAEAKFGFMSSVIINEFGKFVLSIQDLTIPQYFNPIDDEWKREKCSSLGFTYKEPVTSQLFTVNVVPVDILNKRYFLYRILSDLICGDGSLHSELQKKILISLTKNPVMEELFVTKEKFNDYLNKHVIIKDSDMDEGVKQCPVCYEDSTVILWNCKHQMCQNCSEKMLERKQMKCPLCREKIFSFSDKELGHVKSTFVPIELLAAAYYLDVCIQVYLIDYGWLLFRKEWPFYDELDMQNEKCIYLYMSNIHVGVISDVINP
ncbi:uncharacterized protein LOC126904544 isoform X2 [Daktulosphaira vitifoliae]|uniref:uncharacterized protein LOC126904544 isoform X1 n=1 Tax=Daktulosphaira vitifoliae TaxID=58002 RepID=UPI0021AAA7BA|nr:uncharacterized protein LOC126904544 isoform X1 [Daktulosphaira vitifoliae]XP_050539612.1 uncharacterized protein LOC126904544 isoform X2 [Daktulosphaira vitifoliae]